MSKIVEELQYLSSQNMTASIDEVIENASIREIKEYIVYLRGEIKRKNGTIADLIHDNAVLEVQNDMLRENE